VVRQPATKPTHCTHLRRMAVEPNKSALSPSVTTTSTSPCELSWASSASARPGACNMDALRMGNRRETGGRPTTCQLKPNAVSISWKCCVKRNGTALASFPGLGWGWLGPSKTKWAHRTISERATRREKMIRVSSDFRVPTRRCVNPLHKLCIHELGSDWCHLHAYHKDDRSHLALNPAVRIRGAPSSCDLKPSMANSPSVQCFVAGARTFGLNYLATLFKIEGRRK